LFRYILGRYNQERICHDLRVSRRFVSHVAKRHKDWIEMLGLETGEEITNFIMQVLKNPDKIYKDKIRDDVTYFL